MYFKKKLLILSLLISTCSAITTSITATESMASKQVSQDFTSVAKKAIPCVVSIRIKENEKNQNLENPLDFFGDDFLQRFFGGSRIQRQQPQQEHPFGAHGSGFIVSPDGYILTNNHVVKNVGQISVLLNDGRELEGKIIGQDPNTDIAIIKIDAKDLPYLTLGNSDDLEVGQWVVAIGNPLGFLQASLTVGVVSAKGRNNLDLAHIEDFIQTDAAINRGNSGGPLLNLNSEVIGINTAIASTMGGCMGIGFAIPSNMADNVMNQLISNGSVKRGYIGVSLQGINYDLATAFGLDKAEGALIAEVKKDSPAAKAGIKQGDIVLSYNGIKVQNIANLRNAIAMMQPGTKINLSILREGKNVNIAAEVGAFPKNGEFLENPENKLGFEVENLTPQIAQNLGLFDDKGVIVNKIRSGSAAAWAGIKKGALVVEVNQQKIKTVDDFYRALSETPAAKPVLLLIKQDGQMRFISIKV